MTSKLTKLEQASLVEMQAQALLFQFLGLDSKPTFKQVHGALLNAYVAITRSLAPDSVVEVGAHEARFSRAAKRGLKDKQVVAFEANPDVWNTHKDRLAGEGVDYRNLAISDAPGSLTLKVPMVRGEEARTTGSLRTLSSATDFVEHTVEAVRLDDLGFGSSVLWIDVEGATGEVLAGGEEMLKSCLAIMVEVEADERWPGQMVATDVLSYLAERGFVAIMRDVQRSWQYNVVLVREELLFDHRVAPFRSRYFSELRELAGFPAPPAKIEEPAATT
jgi:FkbM family methyltransferase